ncbi:hypothetical protein [Poseidonibacter ostreae]|uniref:Uncharacterized protein n=1 Tax=Poseidonibacter ostreae TaxID=2654171 RepID=A0A6L4WZ33_9BACT|nr:hypothetical protein [Poseidonibacter ostreae]KAB7891254.1 hypothetical protein GBG19_00025 [Poseidonibacter ostreae]
MNNNYNQNNNNYDNVNNQGSHENNQGYYGNNTQDDVNNTYTDTDIVQKGDTIFHPIAYRGFSANSLITFNSFIQEKKDSGNSFVTDVVFIVFREGVRSNNSTQYNKQTEIKIKFNAIELRALGYAIRNSFKLKKSAGEGVILYKANTASAEVQINTSKDMYYINCIKYDSGKKIGVSFDQYNFLAFSDTLKNMADLTESFLYKHQRAIKNQGV